MGYRSNGMQALVRSLSLASLLALAGMVAPFPATAAEPDPKQLATVKLRAELELLKSYDTGCASAHEAAQDRAINAQGAIEEKMQSRAKGALSVREKRDLARIDSEVQTQTFLVSECYKKVNNRRNEIAAILASPEKLQAYGVAFLEQQQKEAGARQAAEAAAEARQAYIEREVRATMRSIFEETKSLANALLASPGQAQELTARAAELQAKHRSALNRLRGASVQPADRMLLEQIGKTWGQIHESLQAMRREAAAAAELASLQAQHEQARQRLAGRSTMVERANFEQLTRTLQGAQAAAKETARARDLRHAALGAALKDMSQVAQAGD